MKVYTIPQKMSGTGNIHDLASDQYDRDIVFRGKAQYAVVEIAYYGGKGYTTHNTIDAAIDAARQLGDDIECSILDADGNEYDRHYGLCGHTVRIYHRFTR